MNNKRKKKKKKKKKERAGNRWLTPVILAAQKAEIRRITRKIVHETLSQKHPSQK
jgi:hypothetical protein